MINLRDLRGIVMLIGDYAMGKGYKRLNALQ